MNRLLVLPGLVAFSRSVPKDSVRRPRAARHSSVPLLIAEIIRSAGSGSD